MEKGIRFGGGGGERENGNSERKGDAQVGFDQGAIAVVSALYVCVSL